MRMMLKWTVPVERGNQTLKDGSMSKTIELLMAELKPEAAYFFPEDGKRAGLLVFDMPDQTGIPAVAERLFMNLDAAVTLTPVMNVGDLKQALRKIIPEARKKKKKK